jgi:hypothetical protein
MNMMNDDTSSPDLTARLCRLRHASAALQPPSGLEAELLARLFPRSETRESPPAATPRARVRRAPSLAERWGAWVAWPVAVTAATALLSWMVYTNPAVAPEQVIPALDSSESRVRDAVATPFLALTSLDDIGTRGEVVSATLPRATLAEFGLPVSPMRAAEPIHAEFLIGADGGVLAVRFVDTASH